VGTRADGVKMENTMSGAMWRWRWDRIALADFGVGLVHVTLRVGKLEEGWSVGRTVAPPRRLHGTQLLLKT